MTSAQGAAFESAVNAPRGRIAVLAEHELPHVEVVRLRPDDVLVLHCPNNHLSDQEYEDLTTLMKQRFPNHEVLVIEGNVRLAVARKDGD
jgi:hypothetical protein